MANNSYIQFPITSDTNALIQNALLNMSQDVPGWVPREGNLEVLLLEQFAQMAAEAATVASDVPKSIFRFFGQLVNITPQEGINAQIKTTWRLVNPAQTGGYVVPAGTVAGFYYNGVAFQYQTTQNYTFEEGTSEITGVTMSSVDVGSIYNIDNLKNITPTGVYLTLSINSPVIANIVISATPATDSSLSVGSDPETDEAYLSRLSSELQFLAPRPITANDFAKISQNVAGVYRAAAIDGFNPLTNRLHATDANTAPQTITTQTWSWAAVGNGTNNPTITNPTSSAPMTVTTSSTAMGKSYLTATAAAGASQISIKDQVIFSASGASPVFVYIDDTAAGCEVLMVTGVATVGTGSGTTYSLTIGGTGVKYTHTDIGSTGVSVYVLQGAKMPELTGLAANTAWYQFATSVKRGNDTQNNPIAVALAKYRDGSAAVFSSVNPQSGITRDYTTWQKTIIADVPSVNNASYIAPSADAPYNNIGQNIVSIQGFVLFQNSSSATTSKTHYIYNTSINQNRFDVSDTSEFSPRALLGKYNYVPDAAFSAIGNSATSSWSVPSGNNLVSLPGYGIQWQSPGTAVSTAFNVDSQIFSLSNKSYGSVATSKTYTVFAYVDLAMAGTTFNKFNLNVIDASAPSGTPLVSVPGVNASLQLLVGTFTLSSPADVQVRLVFDAGLTVPSGSSVVISSIGVVPGSYTASTLSVNDAPISDYHAGYSWTPGDQYVANAFLAPRSVVVVPVASNGLAVSSELADDLVDFLETYREVNFQVYYIQPNYIPINVLWTATAYPGYDTATVTNAGNKAIRALLSPANWAGGTNSPPYWDISKTSIGILDIAGVLGNVAGIATVTSIQIAKAGSSLDVKNVSMEGVAPLPIANGVTGTVYSNSADAALGSV